MVRRVGARRIKAMRGPGGRPGVLQKARVACPHGLRPITPALSSPFQTGWAWLHPGAVHASALLRRGCGMLAAHVAAAAGKKAVLCAAREQLGDGRKRAQIKQGQMKGITLS